MPNISSPLGTSNNAVPIVNQTQIGKAAGLFMHFPTLAALNSAVTAERANIAGSTPAWAHNQPMSVSSEGNAIRYWSTTAQHARNVLFPDGTRAILAADATAAVPAPPSGMTYNVGGSLTNFTRNGLSYVYTYRTVNSLVVPDTLVGGGVTITYTYNVSGQLTGEVVS